jgi:hypothetical protein
MADILSRATGRSTDPAAELRRVATALRSGQATAADADALEAAASELDRRPTTEVLGRIADAFDRRSFALERPAPETWPPAAVQARHGAAGAWGDAALALRGLFADPEWQLAAETILASLRELGRDACAAPSTGTTGTPGA